MGAVAALHLAKVPPQRLDMGADNFRKLADRLITKWGMDITMVETVKGDFNPDTGKYDTTDTLHTIKGHIEPYKSSDVVPGVINIDDLRILVYAADYQVTKDWEVLFDNKKHRIINVSRTVTQNKKVVYELQCRSRGDG